MSPPEDSTGEPGARTTRRPRDRRLTVAREAAEMFTAHGFSAVRMEDIARAVGVTARALYRHYPSKNDLLFAVAMTSQDPYPTALDTAHETAESPAAEFPAAISELLQVTLQGRTHALLWQREARHLRRDQKLMVRDRLFDVVHRMTQLVTPFRTHPTDPATTEILAWSVLSVVTSPGHHARALPRPDSDRLLATVATALARTDLPPRADTPAEPPYRDLTSQRERILRASARLFTERGYPAVPLEDIGEAVGILGPSLYHYFPSKQHILRTLVNRVNEWMTYGLLNARAAADPATVLTNMTQFYISFALRFPELAGLAITETLYLDGPGAESVLRARNELVTEWATILEERRPDLTPATALHLIEIIIALTDDLARTSPVQHADLDRQLAVMAEVICAVRVPDTGEDP